MAIKVTTSTPTSEGSTTTLYFHILEFYRSKIGKCKFPVQYYKSPSMSKKVKILQGILKLSYNYDLEDIGSDRIEKVAYDLIGAELKAAGLNVYSDESGSWVKY